MSARGRFLTLGAVRVASALMLAMAGYLLVKHGVRSETLLAAAPLILAGLSGLVLVVPALTHRWRSSGEPQ